MLLPVVNFLPDRAGFNTLIFDIITANSNMKLPGSCNKISIHCIADYCAAQKKKRVSCSLYGASKWSPFICSNAAELQIAGNQESCPSWTMTCRSRGQKLLNMSNYSAFFSILQATATLPCRPFWKIPKCNAILIAIHVTLTTAFLLLIMQLVALHP